MSSRKAPAQQEIDEEYLRSLMAAPNRLPRRQMP